MVESVIIPSPFEKSIVHLDEFYSRENTMDRKIKERKFENRHKIGRMVRRNNFSIQKIYRSFK